MVNLILFRYDTRLRKEFKFVSKTDKKKIGRLKLIGSRDLIFFRIEQIKRVRIVRRGDGY